MAPALSPNEVQELRRLIPLNTLSAERFEELCGELRIEEAPKGTVLFQQGDTTNEYVYVLYGTISLQAGGVEMDSVTGGSESARFALAHQIPRKVSALAMDQVRYLRVQPEWVRPRKESRPEAPAYQVSEVGIEGADDWIGAILRLPIFQRLPPANLQAFLRAVEEIPVPAGQVICRQDEPGDYYYIIKKGLCVLSRKPTRLSKEIKLATLKKFDSFGEDALISGAPRTVTITMQTDGVLLRLDKANFIKLIKQPLISPITFDAARELLKEGAEWLDVRLPDAYAHGHLPGSRNTPFFSLRIALASLDRQKKYLVVCEDGKLSEAATFLLLRHGFQAQVLKGGLGSLPEQELTTDQAPAGPEWPQEESIALAVAGKTRPSPDRSAPGDRETVQRPPPEPRSPAPLTPLPTFGVPPLPGHEDAPEAAELAVLRSRVQELEAAATVARARETALADRLAASEARTAAAEQRVRALEAAAARVPPTGLEAEMEKLRQRLIHAEQALRHREADFQRTLEEKTRAENDAERARSAEKEVKAALLALRQDHNRLLAERTAGAFESSEQDPGILARELAEARAANAELLRAKEALDEQVSELQLVVEEFLDQGTSTPAEEMDALRSELDMLHQQAEAELGALQARLDEIKAENTRLRSERDALQEQLAALQEAATPVTDRAGAARRGSRMLWPVLAAGLVTALILGGLFGLEPGRDWLRRWLNEPAPAAQGMQPAPPAAGSAPGLPEAAPSPAALPQAPPDPLP